MSNTIKPSLRQRIAALSWETILISAVLAGAFAGSLAR